MSIRVAINGFGRIGRMILRARYEHHYDDISIVAINDLADLESNAQLLRRDTAHGPFSGEVVTSKNQLVVEGDEITVYSERDPSLLPWEKQKIDVVLECTGVFETREKSSAHLKAGAKRVLISAPAGKEIDATVVYGVNHRVLTSKHQIVSNASCTTNCLAPLAKVLHDGVGIERGLMTTVHAVTNDQRITDLYHSDPRRARSAMTNMIPTKTGAAAAVGLVLPELVGKLDGFAIRVPVINVSFVDLVFNAKRATTVEEIHSLMRAAANGPLSGVLAYCDEALVSSDFNHNAHSSIFDATLTKVIDKTLVKVCAWYDNEWGFANRMLDTARFMVGTGTEAK